MMWRTGLAASLAASALMAALAVADCPDVTLKCPTGQSTTIGTCLDTWCGCALPLCCPAVGCKLCDNSTNQGTNACVTFWNQGSWECNASITTRIDGCSASIVTGAMNEFFRVACNLHDVCYHTPEKAKASCDLEFRDNMLRLCAVPTSLQPSCVNTALIAYDAVVSFGQSGYDGDQEWFSNHCFTRTPVETRSWGRVKALYR